MPLLKQRQDRYYWRMFATGFSFALFGVGGLMLGYLVFPLVSLISRSQALSVQRCRRLVHRSFRAFVAFMTVTGVLTWDTSGRDLLARPGQLIVANHPTLIDIVFLISMLPNATCIVKSELYRNIFTRGPVSRAAYVPNDSHQQLVKDCVEALDSGASLVIFPEGTRSVGGQPGHFRRGAAYVFIEARCTLVLTTIKSSPPTLAKGEKWYQIPTRRPHFALHIKDCSDDNIGVYSQETPPSARELTRVWRNHFLTEVAT